MKLNVTKMPRLLVNFQKLDFFQRENNASVEPRKTRKFFAFPLKTVYGKKGDTINGKIALLALLKLIKRNS